MMTSLERTRTFIGGQATDRPPCHPIVMRWAARYAGVPYRAFCLDPESKCRAMLACAEDFDLDWVTTMSDPYAEASAFGLEIEYPEDDLPRDRGGHLPDPGAARGLRPYSVDGNPRLEGRIREIELFRRKAGDRKFVVGWVEGPVAEYANLRGASNAAMDFYDDPGAVRHAIEVILEAALPFITRQVEAGAHGIGIGDAFCSQIGPELYRAFAFEGEKKLVDHIHSLGARAKLHICGDTSVLLPDMIRTGADIVDVDHLVPSLADFAHLLAPGQVFSGRIDPVRIVQHGTPEAIAAHVLEDCRASGGRCIVSAGCELTPETTAAAVHALRAAAGRVGASGGPRDGSLD